jgi:hypothetical protein
MDSTYTGEIKNKDLLDYVMDLSNRRRSFYEQIWYSCLHAYENNHFVGWNVATKSIVQFPTKKRFFIQFPEVKKQVDGFQNIIMTSNPVFQVYPTQFEDKIQQQQAADQSLFLKQHYLDWHEDNVLHTLVHNGGVMPISFIEIAVQQEYDIALGKMVNTTVPRVYDAFDILFDPVYLFDQNPCIVKIIRTTNDMIARSKLYKDFDGPRVSSGIQDMKEIYYIDKFGTSSTYNSNRVLIYECHQKVGNDIKITTIDGQGRVMRDRTIKNMPFFSIIPFQPSSGNAYYPSLAEIILPMNRTMDLVANRIESMTMKYVKGSYMMPANTSVSMSDEDGTILTYKGAVAPTTLPVPQLPDWAWQFLTFIQGSADRYGYNSMTLGGTPKGSNFRSGKMMDKTNQNTMLQQKMYLDNFAYTLKRSAEVMVYLESRLLVEPRKKTLQTSGQSGNSEYTTKSFVGEDYYDNFKSDPNVVPLPKSFHKLDVEIEDESTKGIESKRQTFAELAKMYGDLKQTSPELIPIADALFLKTGDMAQVAMDRSKASTLLASPAFQNIIENARDGKLDQMPQVKQAIATLASALAQDPNIEKPDGGLPEGFKPSPSGGDGGDGSGGTPPPAPGTPPPGAQPPAAPTQPTASTPPANPPK